MAAGNGLKGKPSNNPKGRNESRLYCLPNGEEFTYSELRERYQSPEFESIIKRCQRNSKGCSLKTLAAPVGAPSKSLKTVLVELGQKRKKARKTP